MTLPTPYTGPPETNFFRLDKRLQSLETKIVYIGVPDGNGRRPYWDVWGAHAGAQGITLAPHVIGLMHTPFTQLISEGPYQVGATYERVDYGKREISLAIMIGVGEPDTIFRYRMIEQRWWSSWSAKEDGYLGVFTRTHGWRWLKVRLAENPKTVMTLDPQAMDANFMQWDMTIIAAQPYWAKRQEMAAWTNDGDGDTPVIPSTPWDQLEELITNILAGLIPGFDKLVPGVHIGEGNIVIPNRGDQPAFPKFLVSAPGRAWIQDGPNGRMVELPLLIPEDGTVLVDTDPTARTITAATDPVDPLFYRIARNSELLEFFLHDLTATGLPVWRRFYGRFSVPWPAKAVNRIKVQHSNPGGTITAIMPQKYDMAYG
jgi:hypothetical protein